MCCLGHYTFISSQLPPEFVLQVSLLFSIIVSLKKHVVSFNFQGRDTAYLFAIRTSLKEIERSRWKIEFEDFPVTEHPACRLLNSFQNLQPNFYSLSRAGLPFSAIVWPFPHFRTEFHSFYYLLYYRAHVITTITTMHCIVLNSFPHTLSINASNDISSSTWHNWSNNIDKCEEVSNNELFIWYTISSKHINCGDDVLTWLSNDSQA